MLSNYKKKEIDWDFNQDVDVSNTEDFTIVGSKVFHQKYGSGVVISFDGERADVNFKNSDQKKIFIKYLQFRI